MVVVSYSGKEINAKLVYYGAGLSGKTTNLESIYEAVPDTSRGKMVSMKTQSDRTLFFDLLPLDLGEIMGFKTRFLLYTVPGQVFYNATRKLVLKGADAIVFVADSEVGKMEENKESLANLKANLAEYGLNLDQIPWVIQYNKRDLPNVYTLDELNAELNPGGKIPFFEAVATQGKGVFETFRGISHLLMEKVTRDLRRGPGTPRGATSSAMPQAPSAAAAAAAAAAPPTPVPGAPEPVRPFGPARLDTAAPNAPGRMIGEEARSAQPAEPTVASHDYGREIDLPAEIPPAAQPEPAPPVPAHAKSVPAKPGMNEALRAKAAAVAASRGPAPATEPKPFAPPQSPSAEPVARVQPAEPAPVRPPATPAPPPPAAVAPPAPPAPASPEPPRPAPVQDASVERAPAAQKHEAAAGNGTVVVPVRIPKGASREIVLRIVIVDGDH